MLSRDQVRQFATEGYLVVPGAVAEDLLESADTEIDHVVEKSPPPTEVTGPHFYFLDPSLLPAADRVLRRSGALESAGELVAPHVLDIGLDHIQIALNIPPFDHRPSGPHLDGFRPDQEVGSFTMLAAVYLVDETTENSGNLFVWPGSHLVFADLFRRRGIDVLKATGGHPSGIEDSPKLGEPLPVLAKRGDVLLAHYLLGHNIGGNTSQIVRRILYYRLRIGGHFEHQVAAMTDAFFEYEPIRSLSGVDGMTQPQ